MTDRALFITAAGGLFALALLAWIWWRMYRRNRQTLNTDVGKATRHEFQKHKPK